MYVRVDGFVSHVFLLASRQPVCVVVCVSPGQAITMPSTTSTTAHHNCSSSAVDVVFLTGVETLLDGREGSVWPAV